MTGRPKRFDRDATLAKAMARFLETGYGATSLHDLLAAMGIGRQSLYDTFGSKRDLYLAALARYDGEARASISAILGRPGSPLANLVALVRLWGERAVQRPFRGCLVNGAANELARGDEEIAERVRDHFSFLAASLQSCLEAARAAGELRVGHDPAVLAKWLVNTCQGLIVMARAGMAERDIHATIKTVLSLLTEN